MVKSVCLILTQSFSLIGAESMWPDNVMKDVIGPLPRDGCSAPGGGAFLSALMRGESIFDRCLPAFQPEKV